MRAIAAAVGRGLLMFVALIPLTLLTLIVVGGGESVAALWIGLAVVVGLVACAAGRSARVPLVVLALVAVAHFFVLAATFVPVRVESERELRAAHHGYPIAWVTVEHYWDPPTYPRTYGWNPWEEPASGDDARYLASFALVLAPLLVVARGARIGLRRRRRR